MRTIAVDQIEGCVADIAVAIQKVTFASKGTQKAFRAVLSSCSKMAAEPQALVKRPRVRRDRAHGEAQASCAETDASIGSIWRTIVCCVNDAGATLTLLALLEPAGLRRENRAWL